MTKVFKSKTDDLKEEQFEALSFLFSKIKDKEDSRLFLESFLSNVEKINLSQRLNIIQLLLANCSYREISKRIGVSTATISNAQKCLEKGGEFFHSIMLKYKLKAIKDKSDQDFAPLIRRRIK